MSILPKSPYKTWQILNEQGQTLVEYQSFMSLDFSGSSTAPSNPVEEGSFANYNKVEKAEEISLSIAFNGNAAEIQNAIIILNAELKNASTISIITPEIVFDSFTLIGLKYQRTVGTGTILFDLSLKQVRQVTPEFSTSKISVAQAKDKSHASRADRGKVQAEEPKKNSSVFSKLIS